MSSIKIEKLDCANILEVERIRQILRPHPDLISVLDYIILLANQRISQERDTKFMIEEENNEPDLSDHDSDDD